MTALAIVSGLLCAALVVVVWLLTRHYSEQLREAARERSELLSRIQRPDRLPVTAAAFPELEEPEPDDLNLVGTITYDDDEGG